MGHGWNQGCRSGPRCVWIRIRNMDQDPGTKIPFNVEKSQLKHLQTLTFLSFFTWLMIFSWEKQLIKILSDKTKRRFYILSSHCSVPSLRVRTRVQDRIQIKTFLDIDTDPERIDTDPQPWLEHCYLHKHEQGWRPPHPPRCVQLASPVQKFSSVSNKIKKHFRTCIKLHISAQIREQH